MKPGIISRCILHKKSNDIAKSRETLLCTAHEINKAALDEQIELHEPVNNMIKDFK